MGSLCRLCRTWRSKLTRKVVKLSRDRDLIYANTQKVLVVGAIASFLFIFEYF
ncbi:MAG: hypothetical protein AAF383_26440 [Cyanobacteria bacterium P01_A01_bin.83]